MYCSAQLPIAFDLFFGMYFYDERFFPLVPFQNHIPDNFEIYHF